MRNGCIASHDGHAQNLASQCRARREEVSAAAAKLIQALTFQSTASSALASRIGASRAMGLLSAMVNKRPKQLQTHHHGGQL